MFPLHIIIYDKIVAVNKSRLAKGSLAKRKFQPKKILIYSQIYNIININMYDFRVKIK